MATPKTLDAIEAQMRKFGLTDIKKWPNAKNIDRPGDFDPIGVTIHITAGGLGKRSEETYIDDILMKDPSVPVKCNAAGAPDGTLWLTAQGNSNHCLYYSQSGKKRTEQGKWPMSGSFANRGSSQGWSRYTYGIEMVAASGDKVTSKQYRAAVIWAAAICKLHNWTAGRVHGHGEIASNRGFSDPGINMGKFRKDVEAVLKSSNKTTSKTATKPKEEKGILGMTDFKHYSNVKATLTPEKWQTIRINSKQDVSVAIGPKDAVVATARVTANKLPKGSSLHGRFYIVETTKAGSKRVYVPSAQLELTGDGSYAFGQAVSIEALGAIKNGTKRLRFEACVFGTNNKVDIVVDFRILS